MSLIVKLLGCIFLISACFLSGYSMSRKLYIRRDFLNSFIHFLSSLSTNMRYNTSDIFIVVSSSAQANNLNYFYFTQEENSQSFEQLWTQKVFDLQKSLSLKKTDKELLLQFGKELGKTDVEGQLKHIELYRTVFNKQLSSAEEEINKKSKLYKTMGLFVGISAALMMI